MLTLDHINNDGAKEREETGKSGFNFYVHLRRLGYPEGYQTLCANHQLLKEALRRKRNWIKECGA
jgi:glutamate/tyrosine decarboxylase-like PLP-dependent enzyme